MTRYHTTAEGNIPFTPEEEAEADAREAEFQQQRLSIAKEEKINELKNKYEAESNKNIEFLGRTYRGGVESAYRSKGKADMVIRLNEKNSEIPPYALTFNDINDDPVSLDSEKLIDLAMTLGFAYEDSYQRKVDVRKKINALQTIEEINAFDIDAEWELSNGHRGE